MPSWLHAAGYAHPCVIYDQRFLRWRELRSGVTCNVHFQRYYLRLCRRTSESLVRFEEKRFFKFMKKEREKEAKIKDMKLCRVCECDRTIHVFPKLRQKMSYIINSS